MLIIGFIVVGLALWTEVYLQPAALGAFPALDTADAGALPAALRLIKGVLITLQYANKAAEGRWTDRR